MCRKGWKDLAAAAIAAAALAAAALAAAALTAAAHTTYTLTTIALAAAQSTAALANTVRRQRRPRRAATAPGLPLCLRRRLGRQEQR